MLYVAIWYVSIRYEGEGRTAHVSDFNSPKHVELLNVMNKINHRILCVLLDCICIAK